MAHRSKRKREQAKRRERARPPRRRSRLGRGLLSGAGVLAGVVLSAPVWLSLGPATWIARSQARRRWPGKVEIGSVSVTYTGRVVARGVVLRGPGGRPILSAETLEARPDPFSFLGRRYRLGKVVVADATLELDPAGELGEVLRGLRAGGGKRRGGAGKSADLSARVEVRGCKMKFVVPGGAGAVEARIDSAGARILSLGEPVEWRVEGEAALGPFLAEGTLRPPAPGATALERLAGSLKAAARPTALEELQPLFSWLGLPVQVAGGGEFLLNLGRPGGEGGPWQAALQVKDAAFQMTPAGGGEPTPVEVKKCTASFAGREEPVAVELAGGLAGAAVKVRGRLTLPPPGTAFMEGIRGRVELEARGADLAKLQSFLARAFPGLEGTGSIDLTAALFADKGTLGLRGRLAGTGVTLAGPLLRGDRPRLPNSSIDFDATCRDLSEVIGRVTVKGAPLEGDLLAKADLEKGTGRPTAMTITARVTGSLPALADALPRTLGLREGLVVEEGQVEASLSLEKRAGRLDLRGLAQLPSLRGRVADRPVRLDQPLLLALDAAAGEGAGLVVRKAEFRSGFATVRGRGTEERFHLTAVGDLGKLDRAARQFVRMGPASLAGAFTASVDAARREDGGYGTDLKVVLTDLAVRGVGPGPILEPTASLEAAGVVFPSAGRARSAAGALTTRPAGRARLMEVERLRVVTAGFSGEGRGKVLFPAGRPPRLDGVNVVVRADLARAGTGLGRLFIPRGIRASGQVTVETTAAGTLDALDLVQRVRGAGIDAAGPSIGGRPLRLRGDLLDLGYEARLTRIPAGGYRCEVSRWRLRSSPADGSGAARLVLAGGVRLEEATLRIERLDLQRSAEALAALLPAGLRVRGSLSGEAAARSGGAGRYALSADLRSAGLGLEGGGLAEPWRDDIAFSLRGEVVREGEGRRIDVESLSAGTLDEALNVSCGKGTRVESDGTVRVSGRAAGDVARVLRLARALRPGVPAEAELSLAGRFDARFSVEAGRGRLRLDEAHLTLRDLEAAGTRVGAVPVREPLLELGAGGGEYDARGGRFLLRRGRVRSAALTAEATGLEVRASGGRVVSAAGAVTAAGDLDRLSRMFGWLAGIPAGSGPAGRFKFTGEVSPTGKTPAGGAAFALRGRMPVEGFSWRMAEPRLDLAWDLAYDPATGALSVGKAEVRAGGFAAAARGGIGDLAGRREARLEVDVAYDAAALAGALGGLPADLRIAGRRKARVEIQGPLSGKDARAVLAGLAARTRLEFDTLAWKTLVVREAGLDLSLARGRLRVGLDRWALAGGGEARVYLDIDLAGDPPTLAIPEPVVLASDVAFERRVAGGLLKYLCPAFAEVGRARGRVSVTARRLRLPLKGDWKQALQAEAVVRFAGVELDSSRLIRVLLLALDERPTGLVGDIPPFPVTVAGGRVRYGVIRLPARKDLVIELTGSAGLDGTLDLVATVPLTGRMLGRHRDLERYLAGARVRVRVGGTFEAPRVSDRAVAEALDGLVRDALRKAAEVEARRLLQRWLERRRRN